LQARRHGEGHYGIYQFLHERTSSYDMMAQHDGAADSGLRQNDGSVVAFRFPLILSSSKDSHQQSFAG